MTVTAHQPVFLPWQGFFVKAMNAECMVLLDEVQYPRGRGWMNRNRLKCDRGELWVTVPVHKKGLGLQIIGNVEISMARNWHKKHLCAFQQNYTHAPYFQDLFPSIQTIYRKPHTKLVSLNEAFIRYFWDLLSIKTALCVQSELGVSGRGTELIIEICRHLEAEQFLTFPAAAKYLNFDEIQRRGIKIICIHFKPPVYPQLWGDFIFNLSVFDLLFNCGPKSAEILAGAAIIQ
jgi:hypothetical protein